MIWILVWESILIYYGGSYWFKYKNSSFSSGNFSWFISLNPSPRFFFWHSYYSAIRLPSFSILHVYFCSTLWESFQLYLPVLPGDFIFATWFWISKSTLFFLNAHCSYFIIAISSLISLWILMIHIFEVFFSLYSFYLLLVALFLLVLHCLSCLRLFLPFLLSSAA